MDWTIFPPLEKNEILCDCQFRGGKGEGEQCTIHEYKLMSGFIVHCAVKGMYYTQLLYLRIMETEDNEKKLLVSE